MARRRTTLVSDAVEYIRKMILTYALKPGAPISDNKIALEMTEQLRLNISRSPVREALMILQAEGLVESIDGKVCVARITDRDVFEICQVRDAIEQQAVVICTEKGGFTQEQKRHFKMLYDELVETNEAHNDNEEYLIDDEFHMYLIRCTDNMRLIEIGARMCNQMKRVRWLNMISFNRREAANQEHQMILKAILEDNDREALNAIHMHNTNIHKNFQRIFESDELKTAFVCLLNEQGNQKGKRTNGG